MQGKGQTQRKEQRPPKKHFRNHRYICFPTYAITMEKQPFWSPKNYICKFNFISQSPSVSNNILYIRSHQRHSSKDVTFPHLSYLFIQPGQLHDPGSEVPSALPQYYHTAAVLEFLTMISRNYPWNNYFLGFSLLLLWKHFYSI